MTSLQVYFLAQFLIVFTVSSVTVIESRHLIIVFMWVFPLSSSALLLIRHQLSSYTGSYHVGDFANISLLGGFHLVHFHKPIPSLPSTT